MLKSFTSSSQLRFAKKKQRRKGGKDELQTDQEGEKETVDIPS